MREQREVALELRSEDVGKRVLLDSLLTRIFPRSLRVLLGRESLDKVEAGDHSSWELIVVAISLDYSRGELSATAPFNALKLLITRIEPLIRNNGGTVVNALSQKVVALFQSPHSALDCCESIGRNLRIFNMERTASFLPSMHVTMVIHPGMVDTAVVGDSERLLLPQDDQQQYGGEYSTPYNYLHRIANSCCNN